MRSGCICWHFQKLIQGYSRSAVFSAIPNIQRSTTKSNFKRHFSIFWGGVNPQPSKLSVTFHKVKKDIIFFWNYTIKFSRIIMSRQHLMNRMVYSSNYNNNYSSGVFFARTVFQHPCTTPQK